ncbi:MAG TPA: hypothetical protein VE442_04660 [Jatrophihabitans sp.]|jgi:hypothetical protein|nr:hypothetical protein [Jatrophihabitans sp.]
MRYSAVAVFGGASFLGLVENFVPGGPRASLLPGIAALSCVAVLLGASRWLPIWFYWLLGPLGVVLIGYAWATSAGPGDGAVMYVWPVLWTSYFFGKPGTVGIVSFVAVTHAVVLVDIGAPIAYPNRCWTS